MSSGGASSKEIVCRDNDVVKANVEFRRGRVADNVSKVFNARIGDANRGDFPYKYKSVYQIWVCQK